MTEATPVAMEVWKEARKAWRNYPFTNIDDPHDADDQAAAAVIATALADMQRRVEIFRQIGRWEMAQEIAFNLETPAKDCTPGAPEQAAFDKAAKLVSMSVSALAGREFCKLPVHVQFHDGEWASIMDEATAAISAMQVKP